MQSGISTKVVERNDTSFDTMCLKQYISVYYTFNSIEST